MTRTLPPVFLALLFAGCGGAAPPAPAGAKSAAEELESPEGASAALDRAERSIDQLLGPTQSFTVAQQAGTFAPPTAPAPPPPVAPAPAASAAPDARPAVRPAEVVVSKKGDAPHATASDSCSTACVALASMARAADHLCTLAGSGDDRCTSARTRVKTAAARVHASCPACAS